MLDETQTAASSAKNTSNAVTRFFQLTWRSVATAISSNTGIAIQPPRDCDIYDA